MPALEKGLLSTRFDSGLLSRIIAQLNYLHGSGTFSAQAFEALADYLSAQPIYRSLETGSGASTLLFSHLSACHTVFALDHASSIANVKRSELFNSSTTEFVEGPSQRTLPAYRFTDNLQAALLDGPHAFPFPNLEYYYVYPHLEEGALLVIDDIHLHSVHDLFRFLKADEMFRLLEVCGVTAFFRRTAAPVFEPLEDNWWLQGYNRRRLSRVMWRDRLNRPAREKLRSLMRFARRTLKDRRALP